MVLVTLTNKDDTYTAISGEEVAGGNGDDQLVSVITGNQLFGENGNDTLVTLSLSFAGLPSGGNYLSGGNGEDFLLSTIDNANINQLLVGNANILDGGNAKDFLASSGIYATGAYGTGADMTGGNGMDTFFMRTTSDVLSVTHPLGGEGEPLVEGEVLHGVFDIIRDYKAGELVDIGTTTEDPDGPAIGSIDYIPFHSHVVVDEGTFAFVQGDLTGDGVFEVSAAGGDTLLLYDFDPGPYSPGDPDNIFPSGERWFEYGGSVVFLGVDDPSIINIGDSGYTLPG